MTMQAVAERSPFLAAYDDFARGLAAQPEAVRQLRRRGREVFDDLGLPNTRQEEWRKTNVAALGRTPFRRAESGLGGLTAEKIRPFLLPECVDPDCQSMRSTLAVAGDSAQRA